MHAIVLQVISKYCRVLLKVVRTELYYFLKRGATVQISAESMPPILNGALLLNPKFTEMGCST